MPRQLPSTRTRSGRLLCHLAGLFAVLVFKYSPHGRCRHPACIACCCVQHQVMDGDKAYFFGGGTRGGWSQSNKLQVLSIVPETATCAADNWHTQRSDTTTCGTSLIAGQCHASATFGDAKRTCIAAGGRLCTAAELWHGVARGTGCGLDGESVWTASPCPGADGTRDPSRKQMMQGSGAASFSEVLEEGGPGCCRSATASQGGHYEAVRLATIHDCEQRCAVSCR